MSIRHKAGSAAVWIGVVCAGTICVLAQDAAPRPDVAQLSRELQQTRAELADSNRQIEELRRSLNQLKEQFEASHKAEPAPATTPEPTVAAADQDTSFLAAKINE
jgi:septal ring factor EnvC (AmiA/AmiB activator)